MGTGSGKEKSNDRGEQTAKQDLNKSESECTPFVGTNCFGDITMCDCKGIYKTIDWRNLKFMNCSVCSNLLISQTDPTNGFRYWVCPSEGYNSCNALDHTNVSNPNPYVRVRDKRVTVQS